MVKKRAGLTAGRFTPTVITTTVKEMGPRGAESTFIKVMKWRREIQWK